MGSDLLPIPLTPDLPPVPADPEGQQKWLEDFRGKYNTMLGILRQDINRLSLPRRAGRDVGADVDEIGYVLANLYAQTGNPPPDSTSVDWAAPPRFIPEKIRAFLKKWSFG